MAQKTKIAARKDTGFWRCGTHFPKAGKIVAQDDFTEDQWIILKNEPMLHVAPAGKEDIAMDEARAEAIAEIINSLGEDDFQRDGQPKVAAINTLMDEDAPKVTPQERAEVWAAIQAKKAAEE